MSAEEIRQDCYADVTLVDEESGTAAKYSFKLGLNPFSVVRVIPVPRRPVSS